MLRDLSDPVARSHGDTIQAFLDDLHGKETKLTEWLAVGAPTARDLALKDARVAALTAEVALLRQHNPALRGDEPEPVISPAGTKLVHAQAKERLQEDRILNQLI